MKTLLTGECHIDNIFHLIDPTEFVEIAAIVRQASEQTAGS